MHDTATTMESTPDTTILTTRIILTKENISTVLLSSNADDDDDEYETYDDDDDDGFSNYVETTVDPSPWALILTIFISILCIASIPLLIHCWRRRRKRVHSKQQQNGAQHVAQQRDQEPTTTTTTTIPSEETTTHEATLVVANPSNDALRDEPSLSSLQPIPPQLPVQFKDQQTKANDSLQVVLSNPSATANTNKTTVLASRDHSHETPTTTTARTNLLEEYLDSGAMWHPKHKDVRRIVGGAEAIQQVLLPAMGVGATTDAEPIDGNDDKDSKEDPQPLGEPIPKDAPSKSSSSSSSLSLPHMGTEDSSYSAGGEVSKSGPRRSNSLRFFCCCHSTKKRYQFYRFDDDMKSIIQLAIPFTLHTFIIHIFELLELAIIGRLVGINELSAVLVVDTVLSLATMFLEGSITSLYTLCSQAVGAQEDYLAGQYVQIAVVFYQVTFIPMGVIGWFVLEDIVRLFGFDQEVADLAVSYATIEFVGYLFMVYTEGIGYLLEVTGYEKFSAGFDVINAVIGFVSLFIMAKYGEPSLRDIALLGLAIDILFSILVVAVTVNRRWLNRHHWAGMVGNFAPSNWEAVRVFFKTSIPLSLGYIMSTGEWEVLTILAGVMGPAEVAAWSLLGWLWDAIEEVSLAVADAAEVKVAKFLASGQVVRAQTLAHKSLFLGCLVSVIFSVPILALQPVLPKLFTTDETLQELLRQLIPFVAVGNVALMFGSMCWTILGAQGRYGLATAMGFLGSWAVTLPLSVLLTLAWNWDLQGVAGAVVIGYACSGALNAAVLFQSDWEKLSARVVRDTIKAAGSSTMKLLKEGNLDLSNDDMVPPIQDFDDYDWNELPEFGTL